MKNILEYITNIFNRSKATVWSISTQSRDKIPMELLRKDRRGEIRLALYEHEWRQIEFFNKNRVTEIRNVLAEFNEFEKSQRIEGGWNNMYMRDINHGVVIADAMPMQRLNDVLNVKIGASPVLLTKPNTFDGLEVKDGFTFWINDKVTLYGYVEEQIIPVMGAHIKKGGSQHLTDAFIKLNQCFDLILVDWFSKMTLHINENDQLVVWRPEESQFSS